MQWVIEDTQERKEFREQVRGWLKSVLPDGWMEAVDSKDEAALEKTRGGFDIMRWQKTIGTSGYGAPLWPKEYGGLSGEVWQ